MMRKILSTILISFLLTSCVSIELDIQGTPTPPQNFVTATLVPLRVEFTPSITMAASETATMAATPTNCTTSAILLRDVTIPDNTQVKAGDKFIKTWEFQNTGSCPWINYTIEFSKGDDIQAPLSTPVPAAAPNEKVQVSMELTAPAADGTYAGYFTLHNPDGKVVPIGTEQTFWVKFIVGVYAIIPTASGTSPTQSGNCTHSQNAGYVSELISLINSARATANLRALTVNSEMAAFAQGHAEDMAFNNFLSHDGSSGSFGERMANYNIAHPGQGIFGEILAIGTPQNAMDQWRQDEHWDLVLGNFTQFGVGYAYSSCSDYGGYFTVDFGG